MNFRISFGNVIKTTAIALSLLFFPFNNAHPGPKRPKIDPEMKAAAEAYFVDNLASWEAKTEDERKIVDTISKHLKQGYETFDISLISSVLAQDFEVRHLVAKDKFTVEKKGEYLSARNAWVKSSSQKREVTYNIKDMIVDPSGEYINVLAFSRYKSKYFEPRFIETLLFKKEGGNIVLKQQSFVPIHPKHPELYEVSIIAGKHMGENFLDLFSKTEVPDGADSSIDQLSAQKPEERGGKISILAVFKEPPPIGSKVAMYVIPGPAQQAKTVRARHKVKQVRENFILEAYYHYLPPWVTWIKVRVKLDGVLIAEKSIL